MTEEQTQVVGRQRDAPEAGAERMGAIEPSSPMPESPSPSTSASASESEVSFVGKCVFWALMWWTWIIKTSALLVYYIVRYGGEQAFLRTSSSIMQGFHVNVKEIGDRTPLDTFKGVVFTTHKSWFDFTLGGAIFDAGMLSRWQVAFVVPFSALTRNITKRAFFFKRGSTKGRFEEFQARILSILNGPCPRLLVFPEGTRNRNGDGLMRLRTGMIRICFDAGIPVYIAPSDGAQYIVNEFKCHIEKDQPFVVVHKGIISPSDYETWEAFYAAIDTLFTEGYEESVRERLAMLKE
ncbi:hypothetical protein KIPB_006259 [Kipferlia bialata]|uniref:Phospholipid/glycerol acyltransferase domain-containing protein n=1 Tax=Kipferlia bialata TaxID=797122 RepID=A0A9K3CYL4_9EUKA|nr:hypothetical protein KIPB_006259 [Kipferlia bialata]|eukprot:g6259.t1